MTNEGYTLRAVEAEQANAERELYDTELGLELALAAHDSEAAKHHADRRAYWRVVLAHAEEDVARYVAGKPMEEDDA